MRDVRLRDWEAGDAVAIAPVLEQVINRGRQPGLGSVVDVMTPDQLRAAFTPVQTERLLLRAVNTADVDAVFAIHGNPETYRFHPDGVARSREESAAQLAGWQVGSENGMRSASGSGPSPSQPIHESSGLAG